jgi:NADPH:quinone reductase-like Zn-dependent oxidoreductase
VGFTLAAALPHAAMAAAQAVDEVLAIAPGETVLIHAAAGGVGTVAVQLARRAGATVLGTCSADNDDYLRGLGAVPIRYDRSIVDQVNAVAPDGVDAVLDLIGNDELQDSISVLKPDGRLASTANFGVGALGGQLVAGHLDRKRLAGLVSLLAEGDLTIRLAEQYDLADARAALEHVAGGHAKGKIVITVSAG